jgi:hypothetical protein
MNTCMKWSGMLSAMDIRRHGVINTSGSRRCWRIISGSLPSTVSRGESANTQRINSWSRGRLSLGVSNVIGSNSGSRGNT